MPYAPQVVTQNRVPELIMQGAQATAQGYASLGKGLGQGLTSFFKAEEERSKAAGAAKGFLQDPYFQQRIEEDPGLSELALKIKDGKAKNNEFREFLGSLAVMKDERMREMEDKKMAASIAASQAAEKLNIAQAARMEGQRAAEAAAEERRKRDEAAWAAANVPKLTEYLSKGILNAPAEGMPVMAQPWTAEQRGVRYAEKGGMPNAEVNQFIQGMGTIENRRSATELANAKLAGDLEHKGRMQDLAQARLDLKQGQVEAIPTTFTNQGKTVRTFTDTKGIIRNVETGMPIEATRVNELGSPVGMGVPNPSVFGDPAANQPLDTGKTLPIFSPEKVRAARQSKFTGAFKGTDGLTYEMNSNGIITLKK